MTKTKKILLTITAIMLYLALVIGMGFIWNLFWEIDKNTSIIYWVSKGIVALEVILFAVLMLFAKSDKGTSALQLFFSIMLTFLPLVLRALCMIPIAGKYIAVILGFLVIVLALMLMLLLQGYSVKGKGNQKI